MQLKELTSDCGHATVVLQYDEIRDLSNLLYAVTKENVSEVDKEKFVSLARQFSSLHLLTKDGGLRFLKVDWNLS